MVDQLSKVFIGNSYGKVIDLDQDLALSFFVNLGEQLIPTQLENGALPAAAQPVEAFVCQLYSRHGPNTLPDLRWNLFQTRNLEGEMLPPHTSITSPAYSTSEFLCHGFKKLPDSFASSPKDCRMWLGG
jgi:hypothetical protein